MGVDLKLLPLESIENSDWGFAHSMLELDRRSSLWDAINEKLTKETKENFRFSSFCSRIPDGSWQDERGYGEVKETPYGNPLEWVRAGALADVMEQFYTEAGEVPWAINDFRNKAAIAYLRALPSDNLIALFWH